MSINNPAHAEQQKGVILADSDPYVAFLSAATRCSADAVRLTLVELVEDNEFFESIGAGLEELARNARAGFDPGELRVHAHTVYAAVRLLQPTLVVETGDANGKSSTFILNALRRNGGGKLCSVDLPEFIGQESYRVGDALIPRDRSSGWLVPKSLRIDWDLRLGDARDLLPQLRAELGPIDLFFHDSLHTYDHMKYELTLAAEWVRDSGTIMCDDVQNNAAYAESIEGSQSSVFGTFGFIWR